MNTNALFEQWFRLADEDRDGAIGGMEAVKFFQRSGLPQNILGEIWDHASAGTPRLNLPQFCNAIKLVSLAQMNGGRIPAEQARGIVAGTPMNLPPPKLQGLDSGPGYAAQMTGAPFASSYMPQVTGLVQPGYSPQMTGFQPPYAAQHTGMRPPGYGPQMTGPAPQMTGGGPGMYGAQLTGAPVLQPTYPAVTPKDIMGYKTLFAQLDADADNYVQGGEVAGHFLRSGLDKLVLRDIWAAVAGDGGRLNEDQFIKFAYLVEVSKKGTPVPKTLPAGQFPPINTASSAAMALSSAPRPAGIPMPMPAGPGSMGPAAAGPTGGTPWTMQSQFGTGGMQAAMDQAYNMNVSLPQLPGRVEAPDAARGQYASRVPGMPDNLLGGLSGAERSKLEDLQREAGDADKKLWEAEADGDTARKRAEAYKKALSELTMFKSRTDVALLQAQDQVNRLQQEAATLERQYQSAFSGAEGQYQQGTTIRDHLQKLVARKTEAAGKLSSLQADLQRISTMGPEEMQRLEGEVGALVEQVMGLESQKAAWEIQMQGARQQKELLTRKIADLQAGSEGAEAELKAIKREVRDLRDKVDMVRDSSGLSMVTSLLVKAASAYKTLYHHAQSAGLDVPFEAQLANIGQFMWTEEVLAGTADWLDTDVANNKSFAIVNAFPDLDALPTGLPAAAPGAGLAAGGVTGGAPGMGAFGAAGAAPMAGISQAGISQPSAMAGISQPSPISLFQQAGALGAGPGPMVDDPILNSLGPLPPVKKPQPPPAAAAAAAAPMAASGLTGGVPPAASFDESMFGDSVFGGPTGGAASGKTGGGFDDNAFGF